MASLVHFRSSPCSFGPEADSPHVDAGETSQETPPEAGACLFPEAPRPLFVAVAGRLQRPPMGMPCCAHRRRHHPRWAFVARPFLPDRPWDAPGVKLIHQVPPQRNRPRRLVVDSRWEEFAAFRERYQGEFAAIRKHRLPRLPRKQLQELLRGVGYREFHHA